MNNNYLKDIDTLPIGMQILQINLQLRYLVSLDDSPLEANQRMELIAAREAIENYKDFILKKQNRLLQCFSDN